MGAERSSALSLETLLDGKALVKKSAALSLLSGAGAKLIAPIYQGGALQTQVSIRTLEQKEAVAQYGSSDAGASLGDILGAALRRRQKEEEGEE